jgi:hypothetical protein
VKRRFKSKTPTSAMIRMLLKIADGRSHTEGLHGMAEHNNAVQTWNALVDRGLITRETTLTLAGMEAASKART